MSAFSVLKKDRDNNIIYIRDTNVGMSVTNDAENVYNYINRTYGHEAPTWKRWRVVYMDSQNEWWEMIPEAQRYDIEYMRFERWHGIVWDVLKRSNAIDI
jgi:hypothetical protein